MSKILSQLKKLRKSINIPYIIKFVDKEVMAVDFEEKVIYVHIWI